MKQSYHYLSMAVHAMIQKQLMEKVKEIGLTSGQPKVLDYLIDYDGASQKEIAKACLIEAGSLTSILNRMEEKELVERKIVNGNRRTFCIFLTDQGKEQAKAVKKIFEDLEKEWFEHFDEQEKEQFVKGMEKMYVILSRKEGENG